MRSDQRSSTGRTRRRSSAAKETYEGMAPFNDAFTAHHDYELWIGNLL